jgi:hypothetical protein
MWRMCIACWISKATNTHSEFTYSESVIAFPLQQWLHESSSLLRYTCSACLVRLKKYSAVYKNMQFVLHRDLNPCSSEGLIF